MEMRWWCIGPACIFFGWIGAFDSSLLDPTSSWEIRRVPVASWRLLALLQRHLQERLEM